MPKKKKTKELMMTIDTSNNALNGIPVIQFLVAMQGLEALGRGMMLTRTATPQRLMEIISAISGVKYKRTDRKLALEHAYVIEHAMKENRRQLQEDAALR
jgi:hypothetical protein